MPTPYHDLIVVTANSFDLRPDLLVAPVAVESSGNPWAFRFERSYYERYIERNPDAKGFRYGPLAACSYGLLQILLETACELGFDGQAEQLFDPQIGLAFGAKYLRQCLNRSNDNYLRALARYNGAGAAADAYAEKVFRTAGVAV